MYTTLTLFGNTLWLYDVFNDAAIAAVVIVIILTVNDYKRGAVLPVIADRYFNKKRKKDRFHSSVFAVLEAVVMYLIVLLAGLFTAPYISGLFLKTKSMNYFTNIYFSPVLLFLFSCLLRSSPLNTLDFAAPLAATALIFFKIGCFCAGCCYGIEYGTTFFNHSTGRYEIPIQLIEFACAVIMLIVLLRMRKRKKKTGLMFPVFMLMYCGSRFCTDFLRDDFPRVLGRMTGYHIECMVGIVLGVIYLMVVLRYGDRITEFFESRNKAFLRKKLDEYDRIFAVVHHPKKKKR